MKEKYESPDLQTVNLAALEAVAGDPQDGSAEESLLARNISGGIELPDHEW